MLKMHFRLKIVKRCFIESSENPPQASVKKRFATFELFLNSRVQLKLHTEQIKGNMAYESIKIPNCPLSSFLTVMHTWPQPLPRAVNFSCPCIYFPGTLQASPSTSPSVSHGTVSDDSDSDLTFSVNRSSSASESSLGEWTYKALSADFRMIWTAVYQASTWALWNVLITWKSLFFLFF